jgi:predicted solute-binding protein
LKIRIKVKSPKSEAKQLERKFAESLNVLDKKEKEEKKRKKERKKKAETERCDRACAANVADG